MAGNTPIIYWDACIFLAWLKNETRDDFNVGELVDWLDAFDSGQYKLVTSVITLIEVLDASIPENAKTALESAFSPPRAELVQVTPTIARLAHDIRNEIRITSESNAGNLKTPDAIHLATALVTGASELHTTDCGKSGGRGLIEVSSEVVDRLLKRGADWRA